MNFMGELSMNFSNGIMKKFSVIVGFFNILITPLIRFILSIAKGRVCRSGNDENSWVKFGVEMLWH